MVAFLDVMVMVMVLTPFASALANEPVSADRWQVYLQDFLRTGSRGSQVSSSSQLDSFRQGLCRVGPVGLVVLGCAISVAVGSTFGTEAVFELLGVMCFLDFQISFPGGFL